MPNPENKKSDYSKYDALLKNSIRGNRTVGNRVSNLKTLRANLKKLNAEIEKCYKKDADGSYPLIGEARLRKIKNLYKLCDHSISLAENDLRRNGMQGTLMEQLHKILKQDEACVNLLNSNDIFAEKFRRNIVSTEAFNTTKVVGNALSKRHPIAYTDENGKKIYGFFTETSTVNLNTLEDYENASLYLAAGIYRDANLTDRNCAMTRVANLLGVSDLLAESHSMTVIDTSDGREVPKSGIFMETSKGVTFDNLKDRDDIVNVFTEGLSNGQLKRNISDMQILDYICANVDRHNENMTYVFDESNKLVGIQGIDNDFSMGDIVPEKRKSWLPDLKQMRVISKSMVEKVNSMRQEDLEYVLKGLSLSEKEIESAWSRVKTLQEYIKNNAKEYDGDFSYGTINIVPDNMWDAIDYNKLRTYSEEDFNLFDTVGDVVKEIRVKNKVVEDKPVEKKPAEDKKVEEAMNEDDFVIRNSDIVDKDDSNVFDKNSGMAQDRNDNLEMDDDDLIIEGDDGPVNGTINVTVLKPAKQLTEKMGSVEYASATLTNLAFTPEAVAVNSNKILSFMERLEAAAIDEEKHVVDLKGRSLEYQAVYNSANAIKEWYEKKDLNPDKKELDELLTQAADACQIYINNRNPWSDIGKVRQKIVTDMLGFIGTQGIMVNEYHEYVNEIVTERIISNSGIRQADKKPNAMNQSANKKKENIQSGNKSRENVQQGNKPNDNIKSANKSKAMKSGGRVAGK